MAERIEEKYNISLQRDHMICKSAIDERSVILKEAQVSANSYTDEVSANNMNEILQTVNDQLYTKLNELETKNLESMSEIKEILQNEIKLNFTKYLKENGVVKGLIGMGEKYMNIPVFLKKIYETI